MNKRIQAILDDLSGHLNLLPGVFSTPQWGGRAYKVPGPNGNPNKPKLVAFVALNDARDAIGVQFKLTKERAGQAIDDHDWIKPHSFRTLAPAGWVSARVTGKRQLNVLAKLLAESRALYPAVEESMAAIGDRTTGSDVVSKRIDHVMREMRAEGWQPPNDDDFDG